MWVQRSRVRRRCRLRRLRARARWSSSGADRPKLLYLFYEVGLLVVELLVLCAVRLEWGQKLHQSISVSQQDVLDGRGFVRVRYKHLHTEIDSRLFFLVLLISFLAGVTETVSIIEKRTSNKWYYFAFVGNEQIYASMKNALIQKCFLRNFSCII